VAPRRLLCWDTRCPAPRLPPFASVCAVVVCPGCDPAQFVVLPSVKEAMQRVQSRIDAGVLGLEYSPIDGASCTGSGRVGCVA
jgi:hypothetical protein